MNPDFKVAVYLLLIRNDQLLMSLRKNTGFQDEKYGLVSGHVHHGETLELAMLREAKEETGLDLKQGNLTFAKIQVRNNYVDVYFICKKWKGKLHNREPEKCESLEFFDLTTLPSNSVDYVKDEVEKILKNDL